MPMLMLISPAKTLDFETPAPVDQFTQADFLDQSALLMKVLRKKTAGDLAALMDVSDKIAQLNVERNKSWQTPFTLQNAKQALFAFKGDVYTGLAADTLPLDRLDYLQTHLRMLSGLYGLLRPYDLMQPYRLEMGTKLTNSRGADLYQFWGKRITQKVNEALEQMGEGTVLVNLASNEYYAAIKPKLLSARVVTPVFKDGKNGQYKTISFFAKKARGLMVRYAAENNVSQVENLKGFDFDGYRFDATTSTADQWVFLRDERA